MTHTLTAKEQSLAKIFSDDYVFTIPGYQRPYAWGKEQAQDLLDDLVGALASAPEQLAEAPPYFLGSIVLIKGETSPEATVVDGQQRLTTLTLLLSAIRATVRDAAVQTGITKRIYEHGDVVSATQARYRLLLRDRDREFFRQYVQQGCSRQRRRCWRAFAARGRGAQGRQPLQARHHDELLSRRRCLLGVCAPVATAVVWRNAFDPRRGLGGVVEQPAFDQRLGPGDRCRRDLLRNGVLGQLQLGVEDLAHLQP